MYGMERVGLLDSWRIRQSKRAWAYSMQKPCQVVSLEQLLSKATARNDSSSPVTRNRKQEYARKSNQGVIATECMTVLPKLGADCLGTETNGREVKKAARETRVGKSAYGRGLA